MSLLYRLLSSLSAIRVKLRNRGPDAYRGEVYGDCITIEQRISCDGSRSCRLRSKSGMFPEFQMCWGCIKPSLNVNQTLLRDRAQRNSIKPPSCIHSLQDFCSINLHAHLLRARSCLTASCQLSKRECKYYRLFTFTCGLMFFISCKCH